MNSAFSILQMAEQRDLEDLAQRESDYYEQLKAGLQAPTGMEGGFFQSESKQMASEAAKARKDTMENYRLQRQILEQQKKAAEQARRRAKWGFGFGALQEIGSWLGPIGKGIQGVGKLGASYFGAQTPEIDYSTLWQSLDRRKQSGTYF